MSALSTRTFTALLAFEARSKGATLLLGALVVLLLDAFIAWRVESPPLQVLVALVVAAVPSLYLVFGGLAAFWPEFGSGAHLLLRTVPASGLAVVLAKYVWLLLELAVLSALLIGSAVYFLNGSIPLAEVQLTPALAARLALLFIALLLVPPAIAITASVVGRASRLNLLAGFAAFVLLWWSYVLLFGAASSFTGLGEFTLTFAQLPSEVCAQNTNCYFEVNAALLLLQPLFAAVLLWVAGRAFDSMDT